MRPEESAQRLDVDVAIFGGGVAGLWTLDTLVAAGLRVVLLEARALGTGQTIAAQGIIHGGLKYTLDGTAGDSARATAAMPLLWREHLAGTRTPRLGATTVRADWCSLWRTRNVRSQVGMAGALAVLKVRPVKLDAQDRPAVLADCPGDVYRLDEPVIDPGTLLADLAHQHASRLLRYDDDGSMTFDAAAGEVRAIRVARPGGGTGLDIHPRAVVFTAGAGTASLRERVGLDGRMQRRPLHMVMVRGNLPPLNGHCTDGARTRATITSTVDRSGRTVWQVGGEIAEEGVKLDELALIAHTRSEVAAVLPGFSPAEFEWAAHRVDRAEAATPGGKRPSDVSCRRDGNVITGWPTKLALAPRLAERIAALIDLPVTNAPAIAIPPDWPRPAVATAPWDEEVTWFRER